MDKDKRIQLMLGKMLKGRRIRKGFSQRGFAKHAGLDRSYYAKIENGGADVSFSTLRRISKGLRMNMYVLVKRVEKQI